MFCDGSVVNEGDELSATYTIEGINYVNDQLRSDTFTISLKEIIEMVHGGDSMYSTLNSINGGNCSGPCRDYVYPLEVITQQIIYNFKTASFGVTIRISQKFLYLLPGTLFFFGFE